MKPINEYIYSVEYYRPPTPGPLEWKEDLRNIKELGFNMIQLRVQWGWHERKKEQYYVDDLITLFELTRKFGLMVQFKFLMENAPSWLFKEYDCERIGLRGERIRAGAHGAFYVGGWMPCFDNPDVIREGSRFIKDMVNLFKDQNNLLVWNAWNEPRNRPFGECCCTNSVEKYRNWLKQNYKSVDELNEIHGKCWGNFDEINPPGMIEDYCEMFLWKKWCLKNVADRVKWVYDCIKENDSSRNVLTHAGCCTMVHDVLTDGCYDTLNANQVDFYGSSLPVDGNGDDYRIGLICDWIRNKSKNKFFWINEIYANTLQPWGLNDKGTDIEYRIKQCYKHGARGIQIWQYKSERLGNESNIAGLTEIDGTFNDRTYGAKRAIDYIREQELKYRDKTIVSDIAIYYSLDSDLISRIEETRINNYADVPGITYTYNKELNALYEKLWSLNITPIDIIDKEDLEHCNKYKIIIIPTPNILQKYEISKLEEYVKNGGSIISEYGFGLRDENTWVSDTLLFKQRMFGVHEKNRQKVERYRKAKINNVRYDIYKNYSDLTVVDENVKVLGKWENDVPCLTLNNYGRGKTAYAGFLIGNLNNDILNSIIKML